MRRALYVMLLAPLLLGSKVWVGGVVGPGQVQECKQLMDAVADTGTNPTDSTLGTALGSVLDEQIPAFYFEQTNIPANVCESTRCEAVGTLICEKKPGFGSKASNIIGGYCMTICAEKPVKDNTGVFWVAIECP